MNELEIRVQTQLQKRPNIDDITVHHPIRVRHTCLDPNDPDDQSDRSVTSQSHPVFRNTVTINLSRETLKMMMQGDGVENAFVGVELSDDDVIDEEEESDAFDGFETSTMGVSSSQHSSPSNATSSPINIPGNSGNGEGPRVRRFSSGGTPTHSLSYLSRMFPGAHLDSTSSPQSSGYGSDPRYFHSASTQTPLMPVFNYETSVRVRFCSSSNQSDEQQQHTIRRQRLQERRVRSRGYSENNGDELHDVQEEGAANMAGDPRGRPLPDLVAFRDRSNSAPTNLMRPEIRVGRQLRRISDEFHLTYHDQQRLRARGQQNMLQRLLNALRAYHERHREGSEV